MSNIPFIRDGVAINEAARRMKDMRNFSLEYQRRRRRRQEQRKSRKKKSVREAVASVELMR